MTGQQLLDRLEELLVADIPLRVKEMDVIEQAYCLRIWYFGTDSLPDGRTPRLMLPKETWRQRMLAEKGEQAPYYIWAADEIDNLRDRAYSAELANLAVCEAVADWYGQMPERELPDDNGSDSVASDGLPRR